METKFTKGKWFAVDYAGTFSIHSGEYYGDDDILCYQDFDGQEFCISQEEAEANAKLITAAPELFQLLDFINDAINLNLNIDKGSSLHLDIIEAIQKATE